jgi:hypothetical protein
MFSFFLLLDSEKFAGLLIGHIPAIMYTPVCMHSLMDRLASGGNSPGGAAAVAYVASADLCSEEVSQGNAGSLPNEVLSYSVIVTNTCLDTVPSATSMSGGSAIGAGRLEPPYRSRAHGALLSPSYKF